MFSAISYSAAPPLCACNPDNWRDVFYPLQQFALATCCSGGSVCPLWTYLVQPAAPAPQTTWWLFAVCLDVPELLAVVTLRESTLGPLCLRLDGNVAEAWQMEYFLGLICSRQGYERKGEVCYFGFLGRRPTGGCHLLDANNVRSETHQRVADILSRGVYRQVAYHRLYGVL
jgi:hypothetical protein